MSMDDHMPNLILPPTWNNWIMRLKMVGLLVTLLALIFPLSVCASEPDIASDAMARSLPARDLLDEFLEDEMADLTTRREAATRPTIITYTVQPGDTVSGIARRHGLTIDTLRWSNPMLERNPDMLRPGIDVRILPIPGVYHCISSGDTVDSLAKRYGVAVADIVNYPLNHVPSAGPLPTDRCLVIPHGSKTLARPRPALAPNYPFAWPLVGTITQGFRTGHHAIDIGAPYGSAVYAARAGVVTHAAWAQAGYGYTVIVSHGDGFVTLYSHLKGAWVSQGQRVARGQLIGEVGSTGNSSGPHVHFEIRLNGNRVNPLHYLPPS